MSAGMPWPDRLKYSNFTDAVRTYFEDLAAVRALKMITLGSFPFYLALLSPFVAAMSMKIGDVISMQNPGFPGCFLCMIPVLKPYVLSPSGLISAFVFFIGYNIVTNNRPFDIIKPKVDIIEGPIMEYAAKWRGLYYLFTGLISFALSSIFVSLFIGLPFDVLNPGLALVHLALISLLPACAAVLRAFSPVLTFKQIYPISYAASVMGMFALLLAAVGH
jgi:energy-converting hydrogenase B subunit O